MFAAAHGIERVGSGKPHIIFTMVSGVTASIGSQKTQNFSLDPAQIGADA
jgi:hypothetical protein